MNLSKNGKRPTYIWLVVIAAILLTGSAFAQGWTSLNQSDLGFRVEYPDNWRSQRTTEDLGRIRVSLLPPSGSAKIAIDAEPVDPSEDPMSNFQRLDRSFRKRSGYKKIALKPRRFKGFDAAYWEFIVREKGVLVHKIDIGFHVGSRGYAMLLSAPQSRFNDYADTFKRVVSSLSVN